MVTIRECAFFAKHAYSLQPSKSANNTEDAINIIYKNMEDTKKLITEDNGDFIYDGWTMFPPTKRVCVFNKGDDYIIACRGTVPSDSYDVIRDLSLALARTTIGRKNSYYKTERDRLIREQVLPTRNRPAVENIAGLKEIASQGTFYFVGHSLGGNVAELLASYYIKEGINNNSFFVTFNGAGSGKSWGRDNKFYSQFKDKGINICSYLDKIPRMGGYHLGRVYYVDWHLYNNNTRLKRGYKIVVQVPFSSHKLNTLIDSLKGHADNILGMGVIHAIRTAKKQEEERKRVEREFI